MGQAAKKILFLCTGNSCRSQMAEAWTNHLKSASIQAFSAGTHPTGMNEMAIAAMEEVGIDISSNISKDITVFADDEFDLIITVCGNAAELCPSVPEKNNVVHVGFEDPPVMARRDEFVHDPMQAYRKIRDEIRGFVDHKLVGLF